MYFESLSEAFAMGGYASYVWSAFGLSFLMMLVLWVASVRRSAQLLREVQQKVARQARIEAAKTMENTL